MSHYSHMFILTPVYWLQGGLAVAISIIVQPRLQISTDKLYPEVFIITCKQNIYIYIKNANITIR